MPSKYGESELKWVSRSVLLLGVAVLLLAWRGIAENSLRKAQTQRVQHLEATILELQAPPQPPTPGMDSPRH